MNATERTNWVFVLVSTSDGLTGLGEATLDGHESQVVTEVESLARQLRGEVAVPGCSELRPHPSAFGGLAHAAASSSVEQALWDLAGKRARMPISELLGGPTVDAVRVYANVNRSLLTDRSPEAFGNAAREAVDDGFDAVKIAPFDGLLWEPRENARASRLIDKGLERVSAVRAAIGPRIDLLVDCHFRFHWRMAVSVIADLETFDPYWIEAPVPERDIEGWQHVRAASRARLAGGEFLVGMEAHRRFLQATGVDVVMADVKYCGGIAPLRHIAALAESFGAELAPHNPSGPVATAASYHVASSSRNVPLVEFGWGEVDWRSDLVGGDEHIEGGRLHPYLAPGLGVELDTVIAASHPGRPTVMRSDLWSR